MRRNLQTPLNTFTEFGSRLSRRFLRSDRSQQPPQRMRQDLSGTFRRALLYCNRNRIGDNSGIRDGDATKHSICPLILSTQNQLFSNNPNIAANAHCAMLDHRQRG